jgi:hypothetical protein
MIHHPDTAVSLTIPIAFENWSRPESKKNYVHTRVFNERIYLNMKCLYKKQTLQKAHRFGLKLRNSTLDLCEMI